MTRLRPALAGLWRGRRRQGAAVSSPPFPKGRIAAFGRRGDLRCAEGNRPSLDVPYGLGAGVGRGLTVGSDLGEGVGLGVPVGEGVAVGVGVAPPDGDMRTK